MVVSSRADVAVSLAVATCSKAVGIGPRQWSVNTGLLRYVSATGIHYIAPTATPKLMPRGRLALDPLPVQMSPYLKLVKGHGNCSCSKLSNLMANMQDLIQKMYISHNLRTANV